MLHLKNTGYSRMDTDNLLPKARDLASGMDVILRDCRVSTKYVEFDVSIDKAEIDSLIEKLKPIAPLDHARQIVEEEIEKEKAIKMGVSYFNDERFWEAHEVFEGVWKNSYEGEKELVQGIILAAAALVHYQKAEDNICISVLGRSLDKLARATGLYHNIDVDVLRKKINEIKNSGQISLFTI